MGLPDLSCSRSRCQRLTARTARASRVLMVWVGVYHICHTTGCDGPAWGPLGVGVVARPLRKERFELAHGFGRAWSCGLAAVSLPLGLLAVAFLPEEGSDLFPEFEDGGRCGRERLAAVDGCGFGRWRVGQGAFAAANAPCEGLGWAVG